MEIIKKQTLPKMVNAMSTFYKKMYSLEVYFNIGSEYYAIKQLHIIYSVLLIIGLYGYNLTLDYKAEVAKYNFADRSLDLVDKYFEEVNPVLAGAYNYNTDEVQVIKIKNSPMMELGNELYNIVEKDTFVKSVTIESTDDIILGKVIENAISEDKTGKDLAGNKVKPVSEDDEVTPFDLAKVVDYDKQLEGLNWAEFMLKRERWKAKRIKEIHKLYPNSIRKSMNTQSYDMYLTDIVNKEVAKHQAYMDSLLSFHIKLSKRVEKETGFHWETLITQTILESRFLHSNMAKKNNNFRGFKCFNRKCKKGHCSNYTDDSHKDFFRNFETPYECYTYNIEFFNRKMYKPVNKVSKMNIRQQFELMKKNGYATAKHYVDGNMRVFNALSAYLYSLNTKILHNED